MLKLHTAPTAQAVTTAEAKLQLRVSTSAEDALIDGMIASATREAEHRMGRALLPQKWQLTLDTFACPLMLQRPPVTAVDSVKYVHATTGVLTTLDPSAYQLAAASEYTASLHPAYATSWPVARNQPEAVQVVFSCGYANSGLVPADVKRWMLARVASYYKHREQWTAGYAVESNPHMDRLLDSCTTLLC